MSFEEIYQSLNANQKKVVDSLYGSFMVVAGPGTGKTQVLSARTAKILSLTDANPENILITTFTDAGVVALKQRLLRFIGPASYRIRVTTLHSLAKDIIEEYPEHFIKYRAFVQMDELENFELIESILSEGEYPELRPVNSENYWVRTISERIKKLREEAIGYEGFIDHIKQRERDLAQELSEIDPKLKKYSNAEEKNKNEIIRLSELAEIYREYLERKLRLGKFDFADMIVHASNEISTNDLLAMELAERFQFVMVDEFQDLSNAQNQLVEGLLRMSDTPNILTVGDDDQSIYRFQGANLENMLHFSQKYNDTKIIVLDENYRSGQEILDAAKGLIDHNSTRISKLIPTIDKPLRSPTGKKSEVQVIESPDRESEYSGVITAIELLQKKGVPDSEMAIIVRTNKECFEWTKILESKGISAHSRHKFNLFESEEFLLIRYLFEILGLARPSDYGLIELLRSGLITQDRIGLYKLTRKLEEINYKRTTKLSFIELILDTNSLEAIVPENIQEWLSVRAKVIALKSIEQISIPKCIENLVSELDLARFIQDRGGLMGLKRLYRILEHVRDILTAGKVSTLSQVLIHWERMQTYGILLEVQETQLELKAVQIMTAHQSKGLEYEAVFIPSVLDGNWGNKKNTEKLALPTSITGGRTEKAIVNEEERRLFFVALTRAKSYLRVSFPTSDKAAAKIPSEFVGEVIKTGVLPHREEQIVDPNFLLNLIKQPIFGMTIEESDLAYLHSILSGYRLTPTDLNCFIKNPLEFLQRVLLRYPFEENIHTIFGTCYHSALELFLLSWMKDATKPPVDVLLEAFEKRIRTTYLTPAEMDDARKRGRDGLTGWYDLQPTDMTMPLALEYNFGKNNLTFEGIPMKGRLDRIDLLTPTSVRIIDYKTGAPKSENSLKGGTVSGGDGEYFRQLMFYKLMFSLDANWQKYRVEDMQIQFVAGKDGEYKNVSLTVMPNEEQIFNQVLKESWEKIINVKWWRDYLNSLQK